jgi:curved DNA-binding protein CbpA
MTLCDQFFDDVRVERPPPPPPQVDDDFATLHLQADAPQPLVEAAYRSLAKLWHPDVNRDPAALARMQAINSAYERIRERRR